MSCMCDELTSDELTGLVCRILASGYRVSINFVL